MRRLGFALVALLVAAGAVACSSDDEDASKTTTTATTSGSGGTSTTVAKDGPDYYVLSGQGNNLAAYDPDSGEHRLISETVATDPKGRDINAQICFFPDEPRRFIAGEDTHQPNPPAGWGIFDLKGDTLDDFSVAQVGKLTPTYQSDGPENYGCGFLKDGRLLTTDVGDQVNGPPDGQLIVWFPPFDTYEVKYCKIDVAIGTAGGISVDDQDRIVVASARGDSAGVRRYSGPYPTSNDAAGGCGKQDATGAPLADVVDVETFIPPDERVSTPVAVKQSPQGTYYVSGVITGTIAEYDEDGTYVRTIVQPPAGEKLGATPFSTGTPFGLGFGPDGSLYYADLGVGVTPDGIGPQDGLGTLRRITFVDGEPQPPETLDQGLDFPDGIGIFEVED